MNKEWMWAIGLFEGEGNVCNPRRGSIQMQMNMTDRDVLERFSRTAGGKVGNKTVARGPEYDHWKPQWSWKISGDDAMRVARKMYPELCTRRRSQATKAILTRHIWREQNERARTCPECRGEFSPTFRRVAARQIFCGELCRQRSYRNRHRERLRAYRAQWERNRAPKDLHA